MAQSTILRAKNLTGSTIAAGTAVYISGFDDTDSIPLIAPASCDDESRMPAVGVVREDIEHGNTDVVKNTGPVNSFDTSTTDINTAVYVGQAGSVIYGTEPSSINEGWITQQIGSVTKIDDFPNGIIQLHPLEVKTRIKHTELIEVLEDQHHIKLHSDTHRPGAADQFIHARQHEVGGGDEISHSRLTGIDSDDHTQYSLVDGTRDYTGIVSYDSTKSFTDDLQLISKDYADLHIRKSGSTEISGKLRYNFIPTFDNNEDLVTKRYVDSIIPGEVWRDPVLDKDLTAAPGSPTLGDRYIIGTVVSGLDDWYGHDDEIAEWDGSNWQFGIPEEGWTVWVSDENAIYAHDGVSWNQVTSSGLTGSGVAGEVTFWNSPSSLTSSSNFYWDNSTNRLGIGVVSPQESLDLAGAIRIGNASSTNDGTIRWTGTDFEGRKAGSWVSLTAVGTGGGSINYEDYWNAQFSFNNDVLEALDGYITSSSGGINYDDQWLAQYSFNNDVLEALDGYSSGGGDVTKVGTPVNNQVAVWTGDGTIEGDDNFAWSGGTLYVNNARISVTRSGNSFSATRTTSDTAGPHGNGYFSLISTSSSISDGFAGNIVFQLGDSGGTYEVGNIEFARDGADNNGKISIFSNKAGSANGNITLNTDGRVGIGTEDPDFGLDVETSTGSGNTFAKFGSAMPTYLVANFPCVGLNLYYDSGWKYGAGSAAKYGAYIQHNPTAGVFSILTTAAPGNAAAAATVTERITILSSGEVGIGATAPNEKLTVEGAISLDEISAPSNTTGYGKIYVKSSDSKLYFLTSGGTEYDLTATGSGGGTNYDDQWLAQYSFNNDVLEALDGYITSAGDSINYDDQWLAQYSFNNDVIEALDGYGTGGGDVTKVGTPVDNQVAIWTGDGTIEGDSNFTWDGTALEISGTGQVRYNIHTTADDSQVWLDFVSGTSTVNNAYIFLHGDSVATSWGDQTRAGSFFITNSTSAPPSKFVIGPRSDIPLHFFQNSITWITVDNGVGIGTNSPNEKLTVEGAISLDEITAPSSTAGYGKLYVKSSDSKLYFKTSGGTEYDLTATGSSGGINYDDQWLAQYSFNNDVLEALDGYVTSSSGGINYDDQWLAQYSFNNDVLEALDGYSTSSGGGINYEDQWLAQHSFNNDVLEALDGYSSGGGDVTKVGTPVDNQVAIWTGDGTVEGDANFTWNGTNLSINCSSDIYSDLTIRNTSSGSASFAGLTIGSDSNTIFFSSASSTASGVRDGINIADSFSIRTSAATSPSSFMIGTGGIAATANLHLMTNDTMALTIANQTQYVGIGTTSPTYELDIASIGAYNQVRVQGSFSSSSIGSNARINLIDGNFGVGAGDCGSVGDNTVFWAYGGSGRGFLFASTTSGSTTSFSSMNHLMYIQADTGNVGIGTTDPNQKLDIVDGALAVTHSLVPQYITRTTPQNNVIKSMGSYTALSTASSIVDGFGGTFVFLIGDTGATYEVGGVNWARDGADNNGRVSLATNKAGSASGTLTLDSDGNVGVATTDPAFRLDVEKTYVSGTDVTVAKFGSTNPPYLMANNPGISFNLYYSSGWKYGAGGGSNYGAFIVHNASSGSLLIGNTATTGTAGNAATAYERIVILPAGQVGLGTNSPNEKLTVEGAISLDEITAPSSTAGYGKLYVKSSDSKLYFKTSGGTEYDLTATGSSGINYEDYWNSQFSFNNDVLEALDGYVTSSSGGINYDDRIEALETSRVDILEALDGYSTSSSGGINYEDQWLAQYSFNNDVLEALDGYSSGGGDVTKVGTPADNQVAIWTGDGTIEGDANFTWDATNLSVTCSSNLNNYLTIYNSSSGSSARSSLLVRSDSAQAEFTAESSTRTGTRDGINIADSILIRTSAGSPPSSFMIGTGGSASASLHLMTNDKMALTAAHTTQYIGIGTTDPNQKLDIVDGALAVTHSLVPQYITRTTPQNNVIKSMGSYTALSTASSIVDGFGGTFVFLIGDTGATYEVGGVNWARDGADNNGRVSLSANKSGSANGNLTLDSDGNVGIGTTDPQNNLHIQSATDACIWLEADTDNATETDNAWIKLTQDNELVSSIIGMTGASNVDPDGNVVTGAISNALIIHNFTDDSNGRIQLATNNVARLSIVNEDITINGNVSISGYLDYSGFNDRFDAQNSFNNDVIEALDGYSSAGVSDHGLLTGLGGDDHTQYALLAGRAGGQILYGGTASGDDLTLKSTSNATLGTIYLGDECTYTDSNQTLTTRKLAAYTATSSSNAALTCDADGGGIQIYAYGTTHTGTGLGGTVSTADTVWLRTGRTAVPANLYFGTGGQTPINFFTNDILGMVLDIDQRLVLGTGAANEKLTVEGAISLDEITAPSNTSGYGKIYVKSSDSKLYFKTSGGTEYDLTATGSGGINYEDYWNAQFSFNNDVLEALDGYATSSSGGINYEDQWLAQYSFNNDVLEALDGYSEDTIVYTITTSKTSNHNASFGEVVRCDPSGGGFTVTLPVASGGTGQIVVVKNTTSSTNTITIDGNGAETIDGNSSVGISEGFKALTFVSYGSEWGII